MSGRLIAVAGLALGLLGVGAGSADAHELGTGGASFFQGLGHPLSGMDHLMAMVAVGLWASQIGRPAWWMLPIAFPAAMAVGALLGGLGVAVPAVEAGIALSVLALGLLIAFAVRPGLAISLPLVALFALFHGHAHGAELPATAAPLLYGMGFILATAALHGLGLGMGYMATSLSGRIAFRTVGATISVAGAFLLLG